MKNFLINILNKSGQNKEFYLFSILSIFGATFTALTPLFIAKLLEPTTFGIYSLVLSITFFFLAILVSSSQTSLIILLNRERKKTAEQLSTLSLTFIILFISTLLSIFVFYLSNNWISKFIENYTISWIGFSAIFSGYSFKTFSQTILLGLEKKTWSVLIEVIFGITTFALIVILCITGNLTLNYIFIAYFISGSTCLIITRYITANQQIFPLQMEKMLLSISHNH